MEEEKIEIKEEVKRVFDVYSVLCELITKAYPPISRSLFFFCDSRKICGWRGVGPKSSSNKIAKISRKIGHMNKHNLI